MRAERCGGHRPGTGSRCQCLCGIKCTNGTIAWDDATHRGPDGLSEHLV